MADRRTVQKADLIQRIPNIAALRLRIELTQLDAVEFIEANATRFQKDTLLYIDPPYFEKGRYLHHDAYAADDHATVAAAVTAMENMTWVVSCDDVQPIHTHYAKSPWLQYTLNDSARNVEKGREVMFFSRHLIAPEMPARCRNLSAISVRGSRLYRGANPLKRAPPPSSDLDAIALDVNVRRVQIGV